MTLLFEDVGFRLPFPDEELAQLLSAECEPFAGWVDGDGGDAFLRDAEGVDVGEVGHLPESEDAGGETDDEEVGGGVPCAGCNFGVSLVEVVAGGDSPSC